MKRFLGLAAFATLALAACGTSAAGPDTGTGAADYRGDHAGPSRSGAVMASRCPHVIMPRRTP